MKTSHTLIIILDLHACWTLRSLPDRFIVMAYHPPPSYQGGQAPEPEKLSNNHTSCEPESTHYTSPARPPLHSVVAAVCRRLDDDIKAATRTTPLAALVHDLVQTGLLIPYRHLRMHNDNDDNKKDGWLYRIQCQVLVRLVLWTYSSPSRRQSAASDYTTTLSQLDAPVPFPSRDGTNTKTTKPFLKRRKLPKSMTAAASHTQHTPAVSTATTTTTRVFWKHNLTALLSLASFSLPPTTSMADFVKQTLQLQPWGQSTEMQTNNDHTQTNHKPWTRYTQPYLVPLLQYMEIDDASGPPSDNLAHTNRSQTDSLSLKNKKKNNKNKTDQENTIPNQKQNTTINKKKKTRQPPCLLRSSLQQQQQATAALLKTTTLRSRYQSYAQPSSQVLVPRMVPAVRLTNLHTTATTRNRTTANKTERPVPHTPPPPHRPPPHQPQQRRSSSLCVQETPEKVTPTSSSSMSLRTYHHHNNNTKKRRIL